MKLKPLKKLLFMAILPIVFFGCSSKSIQQIEDQKKIDFEKRVETHKVRCELIGFKSDTKEGAFCVLELEKAYYSNTNTMNNSGKIQSNDSRTRQLIQQDRIQRQMMQHGAGGCTPNFSTGGCL